MLAEHGIAYTIDRFECGFGRTSHEILAEMLLKTDEATRVAIYTDKESRYRRLLTTDFPAMPGAVALIDALHDAGWALAVGSSGPPENVQVAVEAGRRTGGASRMGRAPCCTGSGADSAEARAMRACA